MLTGKLKKSILRQTGFSSFLNKKCLLLLLSVILIVVLVIGLKNSFAVENEVRTITITSNELTYYTDAGSWATDIGAYMNEKIKGQVEVTYNFYSEPVTNDKAIDLVLMIDDSSEKVWSGAIESFADMFLAANKNNNTLAVIRFNSVAEIISNFALSTDELGLTNYGNVDGNGGLSYYAALEALHTFLSYPVCKPGHDLKVMLITDGDPAKDLGKEKDLYTKIRNDYPNLSEFYAIQYNEKGQINETLREISDIQYLATTPSECESLYWLAYFYDNYDSFRLTTQINDDVFDIVGVERDVPWGEYSTIDGYFDLSFGDNNPLPTGTDFTFTVTLKLKDEYKNLPGLYHILKDTTIDYKLGDVLEDVYSDATPIISNYRSITYNGNTPPGCTVSNLPSNTTGIIGDVIKISDKIPVCNGYQFNGWDVSAETKGDSFVMPEMDVKITAKWSKLSLNKSMDGTISNTPTLYKLVADNSRGLDTNIDFTVPFTDDDSGVYTRQGTETDKYPIHYYRGNVNNNNVLFAELCWKMVRTTSTGGVKLIYNGVPDSNGGCDNTDEASQISTSEFNSSYVSPTDVGYMYNESYTSSNYYVEQDLAIFKSITGRSSTTYYSNSVTYSDGMYHLVDAVKLPARSMHVSLSSGWYVCSDGSSACSTIYYVIYISSSEVGSSSSSYYYYFLKSIPLSNGVINPDTQTITLGKGVIDNKNGSYTLTNTETLLKRDWHTNYNNYNGYYICQDLTSTTCNGKYKIVSTNAYAPSYDKTFNFTYGNDVSWDGEKYTLLDVFTSTDSWSTDNTTIAKKYHYTCLNTTGTCTSVYYIIYFGNSSLIYYLSLSNGKNIDAALDGMFSNIWPSTIMQVVDTWFQEDLINYEDMLEDTIWCNDRSFYNSSLAGKDVDAGSEKPFFSAYNRVYNTANPNVSCPNVDRDGLLVLDTSKKNGVLGYPIGLLTADEVMLAGGRGYNPNDQTVSESGYLSTGQPYWTLSPAEFDISNVFSFSVNSDGNLASELVISGNGVRPAISLKKSMKYTDGDGTVENPYVVE